MIKEELDEITNSKEIELQRVKEECKELKQELSTLISQHGDTHKILELEIALEKAKKEHENINNRPEKKVNPQNSRFSSRRVSSEILDYSSNGNHMVNILVKVRPVLDFDSSKSSVLNCKDNTLYLNTPNPKTRGRAPLISQKKYEFSKILDQHSTIDDTFQEIYYCVEHAANGGRSCIIAYGQTGSGKTHTMSGVLEKSFRCLEKLLENSNIQITLHCIEIYNEQARNLLTDGGFSKN